MPRTLHEIALDIDAHWPKVNFAAKPYLEAMRELHSIDDWYYADRADMVVRYFLGNAGSWRGEHARRIKAELRSLL